MPLKITVIDYDEEKAAVLEDQRPEDCKPFLTTATKTWINVDGIPDASMISTLQDNFNLHPLTLEDITLTDQRPKFDDFGDYLFFVVKMLSFDHDKHEIKSEQVSIVVTERAVISFQEDKEGDAFDGVRKRILRDGTKIRKSGTDYLAYCLLDALIDQYFSILEEIADDIDVLEQFLLRKPTETLLRKIYHLKSQLIILQRTLWPLRDVIHSFAHDDSPLIGKNTRIYLNDVHHHAVQIIDTVDTSRDLITSMLEIYLSTLSNRMNSVMKILTIITTIFIPLTFISSIYGMNFHFMPELEWPYGYPLIIGVMMALAGVMVYIFKRKRWF